MVAFLTALFAAIALALPTGTAGAVAPPVVAVIGDSYTAGWGTACGCQSQAWFQTTAADLGWQPGNVVADPGAGFQKPGTYGTLTQALTDHPIPAWTDYVLIQGGLNDTLLSPAAEPAAIHALLAVVHAQAPNAVPIVIGAFFPFPDHLDSPNQIPIARAMGDYNAIGSTRYVEGMSASFQVCGDAVHPTTLGHRELGDWIFWHLVNNMSAGPALVNHPELGYWTV